jgi:YbbR domain-containing protein
MFARFRGFGKNLPTLLLAFALAVTVWISAVTQADPTKEQVYPNNVSIEVIGQDPALMLTSPISQKMSITFSAPTSIWTQMLNEQIPVRAVVDLSGVTAGTHEIPVQIQVGIRPVEIVSYNPRVISVTLETLSTQTLPIHLVQRGEIAVGFQTNTPKLSQTNATVSGPSSLVKKVQEVRAVLDLTDAKESIDRELPLVAVDADENTISGLTITPDQVRVNMAVNQRGGFRNVVVKVVVSGRVASGYRVTNISVFPPTVTVFSTDPKLVDDLPGYVETATLDLENAKDDRDIFLPLALPDGVSVVGDSDVEVQVGIAAIEGSVTLSGMKVEITGVGTGLNAAVSPDSVDVIISGPLPVLDQLTQKDIRVIIDVTDMGLGTYQLTPKVELQNQDLTVESILPASVEVTLTNSSGAHPTSTPVGGTKQPEPTATGSTSAGFVTPAPSPTP